MKTPIPPRNVRLIVDEVASYPLEVVYAGAEGGIHVWSVVAMPLVYPRHSAHISVDVLPPRTSIQIQA